MSRTQAKLLDGIPMRGDLSILVRSAISRKVIRRIAIRNKITFLAADVLVEMLAQRLPPLDPLPAYDQVWSMRMGLSNTVASRADQNLGAFATGKQLFDVNKVTGVPGELEFTATLESGDSNGVTLQEAGLFTRGSAISPTPSDAPGTSPGDVRMFARQIHPAIPKTSAIVLEYSWRIAFTA
jgi:hypothetical protein